MGTEVTAGVTDRQDVVPKIRPISLSDKSKATKNLFLADTGKRFFIALLL